MKGKRGRTSFPLFTLYFRLRLAQVFGSNRTLISVSDFLNIELIFCLFKCCFKCFLIQKLYVTARFMKEHCFNDKNVTRMVV